MKWKAEIYSVSKSTTQQAHVRLQNTHNLRLKRKRNKTLILRFRLIGFYVNTSFILKCMNLRAIYLKKLHTELLRDAFLSTFLYSSRHTHVYAFASQPFRWYSMQPF